MLRVARATPSSTRSTSRLPLRTSIFTGSHPALTLDDAAPTSTVAKYKDSPSVNRTAFKEIGTWTYVVPAGTTLQIDPLTDLRVWVGLKNSDDQGTYFDIRAELLKNGTPVASGETQNIQGITRNPDKAKEVVVAFGTISDRYLTLVTFSLSES